MDLRGTVVCANPSCRARVKAAVDPSVEIDRRNMRAECHICGTVRSRNNVHMTDVVTVLYGWNLQPYVPLSTPVTEMPASGANPTL
jgi:hypothetical protein